MNDNPFTAWANQLLEYQRQYQDVWQTLASSANGARIGMEGLDNASPWIAALDQWWKAVSPSAAPSVQNFYSKLIEQGKAYFQVTDGLSTALQQATAAGESAMRWQEAVNVVLSSLRDMFAGQMTDAQGTTRQAIAFWELPLNTWRRAVSSSILPGDFLRDVGASSIGQVRDQLHGRVDQLLSTPAIGYMREDQEKVQTLIKLNLDYQLALLDYVATCAEIGVKCVEVLQQNLQQRVAEGKPIESLRELYDLWVDSCEQAYGDYVSTDKYVEIYGRLVNSLMTLKQHGHMMVDEVLNAVGMPTRREIRTLVHRMHEVRWEGKALRAEIEILKEQHQASLKEKQARPPAPAVNRPKRAAAKTKAMASKPAAKSKPDKTPGPSTNDQLSSGPTRRLQGGNP
jgi:class III poly(R)-hydroxyalkanoic acid synthase PhaE subunit